MNDSNSDSDYELNSYKVEFFDNLVRYWLLFLCWEFCSNFYLNIEIFLHIGFLSIKIQELLCNQTYI